LVALGLVKAPSPNEATLFETGSGFEGVARADRLTSRAARLCNFCSLRTRRASLLAARSLASPSLWTAFCFSEDSWAAGGVTGVVNVPAAGEVNDASNKGLFGKAEEGVDVPLVG